MKRSEGLGVNVSQFAEQGKAIREFVSNADPRLRNLRLQRALQVSLMYLHLVYRLLFEKYGIQTS